MSTSQSTFPFRLLAMGAALALPVWFHSQLLAPLQKREAEARRGLDSLRQRVGEAQAQLQEITGRLKGIPQAGALSGLVARDAPSEPTAVWLPERLKSHLVRSGITEVGISLNSAKSDPAAAGYERSYWHLNFPAQSRIPDINTALLALTEIERQEPCIRIKDVYVGLDADQPHSFIGSVTISAFGRK
jgi:hypothetical protein